MNTNYRLVLLACGFGIILATLSTGSSVHAQGFGRYGGGGGGNSGGGGRDWGRRGGGGGGGGGDWREKFRGEGERRDGDKDKDKPSDNKSGDSKADPAAELARTKAWAEGLVKEKDKDKNGFLKGDEIKELGGSAAKADLNNDGAITVEELVANASKAAAPSSGSPTGGSGSGGDHHRREGDGKGDSDSGKRVYLGSAGGSGSKSKDKEGDGRKSYRFRTATEVNGSLPESLRSKDKDGDGQVSMSEFSRSWSKSTVADFRKLDLNDDGMITAKEAGGGKKPSTGG